MKRTKVHNFWQN